MEEQNNFHFIKSFKKKNPISIAKSILQDLPPEDLEQIIAMSEDKDLTDDIGKIFIWFLKSFESKSIPEFLVNFQNNLEKSSPTFPVINDIKNLERFWNVVQHVDLNGTFPRHKLIQRAQFYKDFDIDKETFTDWLTYFGLEKFHGQREFNTLENGEILRAFTAVKGLNEENISGFHFKAINKLTIGKIIVGDFKSNQTVYRKLQKLTDEIDDLNPDNRKLIEWVSSHRKMPFSLAHRWVSLILEAQNHPKVSNTLEVFEEYFSQK